MDSFFYFSFIQGMLAFFAPCAVALLPAYVVAFIARNEDKNQTGRYRFLRSLKFALLSVLGILVVYAIAGLIIVLASQLVKEYVKWVAMAMGVGLIVLGILTILGRNLSLNIHLNQKKYDSELMESFFFGAAYAVGALGCLFPLFLVVATQALSAPSILVGGSYIVAYFAGISTLMIATILISTYAKNIMVGVLKAILPQINRITGALLIVAGIYIIQYQLALVLQ